MNKQVLNSDICVLKITPQQLNESKEENNGALILKNTILQRADSKNQNGRKYPKKILMRESAKYEKNNVAIRNAIGELDHPDSDIVCLSRGALHINKIWWNGNDLMGDVEILTNLPNGKILEGYLRHGITIGISSRGLGSVKQLEEGILEVQEDFELISFDAVSTPSTQQAYLKLNEGKRILNNKYSQKYLDSLNNINSLIDELLFDKE
jgi:hypothetical protein